MKIRQAKKIMRKAFNLSKREWRIIIIKGQFPYWDLQSLKRDHRITKAKSLTIKRATNEDKKLKRIEGFQAS